MIYSLPDNIRYKSYIYKKVLNKFFPDFFNNIPWQKTGYPISYNQLYVDLLHLKDSVIRKLRRECDRFGFAYDDKKYYTNYFRWIQEEPARSFFYNILVNEHSLYPQYFNKMNVTHWLDMHMNHRRDFSEELCRALTFEIWLQQVYEGKYRDKNCEIL